MQKKIRDKVKEKIIERLANKENILLLSKKWEVSQETLYKWNKKFNREHRENLLSCLKSYKTYQAYGEEKRGTSYDSKLGGIPYIDEDKDWVGSCPNCNCQMVLLVQLNIQTLPEIPKGLEEWDFIQVYTCMNPNGGKNCFQMGGYHASSTDYDERKPFNRSFHIELVKKENQALELENPLWVDDYDFEDNEETKRLLAYASENVIVSWGEKEELICADTGSSDDIHCNEYFSLKRVDVCVTGKYTDLFGLLDGYDFDNRNGGIVDNYPYCHFQPMTILYQFIWTEEKLSLHSDATRDYPYENVYALFYCPEHPELMSCQWVSIYK